MKLIFRQWYGSVDLLGSRLEKDEEGIEKWVEFPVADIYKGGIDALLEMDDQSLRNTLIEAKNIFEKEYERKT